MKLPKAFNYAEAYLTFRCGLGCDYCINKFGKLENRGEMDAEGWMKLNNIDFGSVPLTLGGGEPTRHPEFFDIVNGLNMPLDLLTNLTFDINAFIEKVDPEKFSKSEVSHYHPIRASYHADKMDRTLTIAKVKKLREAGFNVGLFGVRHPYTINENMAMAFSCAKAGVPFYEKDFLGEVEGRIYGFYKYPAGLDGEKKIAKCKSRELLIAPNGDIHKCHRDLYAGEFPIGNITESPRLRYEFHPCTHYGECNPCDLKLKTNRFLKGVECQVEIL